EVATRSLSCVQRGKGKVLPVAVWRIFSGASRLEAAGTCTDAQDVTRQAATFLPCILRADRAPFRVRRHRNLYEGEPIAIFPGGSSAPAPVKLHGHTRPPGNDID